MQKFNNNGVEIAYATAGNSTHPPILLIHGFGSTYKNNWIEPGWTEYLVEAGYFVVMLDNRGHGNSAKLYNKTDYDLDKMTQDGHNLMLHLSFNKYDVMGYSMGARISGYLAMSQPNAVKHVILGGLGDNIIHGTPKVENIAAGLLADNLSDVKDPIGRMFRIFAEHTGSDRKALAACILAPKRVMQKQDVMQIKQPTLVAIGTADDVAGDGEKLVDILPNGTYLPIPKRDHMRATGDKVFKIGVVEFLSQA